MDETLPKQEQLSEPESLATPDVTKALDTIMDTETKIGEHFGLAPNAPELPDLTDDALVHVAKRSSDLVKKHPEQSEVAKGAVKTVLIEGALEVTGDRPEGTENPIIKLENDGYDEQVTEAIRGLHEEGAVLPNGESVAETIAITIMSQEMTSEEYDSASKEAGWDSPERAQKLVEGYVTPGSKVLDIGIGTGQAVEGYAAKGATVIGLDHDASMLDKASSIVGENGSLRQADINMELPIADLKESVDVAQAIGVLEFAEDLPAILDQVHGSLKENGVFVFTSELSDNGHAAKSHFEDIGLTVHRHSTDEIKGMLEKSGYTLLSSEAYDGYQREDGEVPYGIFLAQKTAEQAERPQISDELDTALQYYYQGASKEDMQKFAGVDPKEITAYINSLPEDERAHAIDARKRALGESAPAAESHESTQFSSTEFQSAFVHGTEEGSGMTQEQINTWYNALPEDEQKWVSDYRQSVIEQNESIKQREATIEGNLEASAPELLRGQLPQDLADRMGSEYTLGVRQLESVKEVQEAEEKLRIDSGINVEDLGFDSSFDTLHQKEDSRLTTRGRVIAGYYNSEAGGKYVIAIPTQGSNSTEEAYQDTPDMRRKSLSSPRPGSMAVNPKYIAGFIDGDGTFHPNENFMRSDEAKLGRETATPQAETVESTESANPYERLSAEQLTAVRDNIADSIVEGIRKYDPAEVTRAATNLAAIQREIQARSPEQAAHQRGEVDGAVTYITEPDAGVIQKIVSELQKIDGAPDIARKLYGGLEIPAPSEENQEARLQAMELQSLLAGVSREIRNVTGSEFSESTNPYASMKNEELATTVDRLKQTIQDLTAQGADTTDYRTRLAQIGEVIRNRS